MPWIAALITAGAGYMQSRDAKKELRRQEGRNDPMRDLIMGGIEYSQPFGKSLVSAGHGGMMNAYNHYNDMMWNPSKSLAPQLTQLGDQFQNAAQNTREFGQRGGMTSNMATQQPFEQAKAQSNLISQGREAGARGVAGMSGQMLQGGNSLLKDGQMTGLGLMGQNTIDSNTFFNMGSQVGGGLGGALGAVDWQSIPWGQIFGSGQQQDTIGGMNWGNILGNQAGAVGQQQGYDWGNIFGNQARSVGQSQPTWNYWGKGMAGWGG